MTLIALKDLSLVRSAPLFSGLTLAIAKGDRLGLVAGNGHGKSSLLRIMAGLEEATAGSLSRSRGLTVALAPQDPPKALLPLSFRAAVRDALAPEDAASEEWRVDILLDALAVDPEIRGRPVHTLSGGWQRTMLLARAAVTEPALLLLDEPTNHLDLGRIGLLERFLKQLPRDCALVAASHDRAFLDSVTGLTLFLRPAESLEFPLPYAAARRAADEHDAARDRQFTNDMRKARALRQQAAKLKNIGVNSGPDLLLAKTKQLSERAERLEERSRPAHQERSAGAIRLASSDTHAKALVTIQDARITTPDGRPLFRTGRLWIEKGDRVALLGANGSGKTQLVRRLQRALVTPEPQLRGAASLRLGYSDQNLSQLDGFPTPWMAVKQSSDLSDPQTRAQLAGAGIGINSQGAPIARLSGGQKARLALLLLRLGQPNFYLLDEPTNHLDIDGQEMLQAELLAQGAACLLISHDRAFVRAVATRIWAISGQSLVELEDPSAVFLRLMGG